MNGAGRLALRHIERARDLGYRVVMYYIGVDSPETSLARIAYRVSMGGHPIDEEAVRRRYRASLGNLARVIDRCDDLYVLDNTTAFTNVAQ